VSTNVGVTVSVDICGTEYSVPGGIGGGLSFGYHAGNVTFVAQATADGKAFKYWYVVLASQQEKVTSAQVTLFLPAGYAPGSSIVEAFYG